MDKLSTEKKVVNTYEVEAATYIYRFGFLTRAQARRTFRCNMLTGLINKVNLQKEQIKDKKTGQVKSFYFIETTRNYTYMVAEDLKDAKAKFEAFFKEKDAIYQKLLEEKKSKEAEEKNV